MPSGKLSACMFFCKAFVPKDDELYIELKDYEFQLNENNKKSNKDKAEDEILDFIFGKNNWELFNEKEMPAWGADLSKIIFAANSFQSF